MSLQIALTAETHLADLETVINHKCREVSDYSSGYLYNDNAYYDDNNNDNNNGDDNNNNNTQKFVLGTHDK
jgi:hypothetical protein